jgi:hypothetical protein
MKALKYCSLFDVRFIGNVSFVVSDFTIWMVENHTSG